LLAGCAARLPRALACACAILCGAGASAATTAASAEAAIVTPLSLVNTADLDFGKIIQPTVAGTVVLTPAASASCTVTGGLIRTGTCQAAEFYGRGANNQIVRINNANSITVSNGSQNMTINAITMDPGTSLTYVSGNINGNGAVRWRITDPDGLFSFRVGGTLHVKKNQQIGVYTGTFSVDVQYQ
jgi:hypothetical protein